MTTLMTLWRPVDAPKEIHGHLTCSRGHLWFAETTRWRFRKRNYRDGVQAHKSHGWERDCITCRYEDRRVAYARSKGNKNDR